MYNNHLVAASFETSVLWGIRSLVLGANSQNSLSLVVCPLALCSALHASQPNTASSFRHQHGTSAKFLWDITSGSRF